jgi:hypothetical protein
MNNGLERSGDDLILNRATVPTFARSDWGIQPKSPVNMVGPELDLSPARQECEAGAAVVTRP